jgi:hypothetical protein
VTGGKAAQLAAAVMVSTCRGDRVAKRSHVTCCELIMCSTRQKGERACRLCCHPKTRCPKTHRQKRLLRTRNRLGFAFCPALFCGLPPQAARSRGWTRSLLLGGHAMQQCPRELHRPGDPPGYAPDQVHFMYTAGLRGCSPSAIRSLALVDQLRILVVCAVQRILKHTGPQRDLFRL